MKKLSLDYGDVRIGMAISDSLNVLARGLETYKRVNIDDDLNHIADIINSNNIDTVVVGLPLNMDGTIGKRAIKTKDFMGSLKKHIHAKIIYEDERLTSVTAEEMLIEANVSRKKRKEKIDRIAAIIILQSYLDKL